MISVKAVRNEKEKNIEVKVEASGTLQELISETSAILKDVMCHTVIEMDDKEELSWLMNLWASQMAHCCDAAVKAWAKHKGVKPPSVTELQMLDAAHKRRKMEAVEAMVDLDNIEESVKESLVGKLPPDIISAIIEVMQRSADE